MNNKDIHIGLILPVDGLPLILGRVYDPKIIRRALREAARSAEHRAEQQGDSVRRPLGHGPVAPSSLT